MEENINQGGELFQIAFLGIWCLGLAIVAYKLAKDKGRSPMVWTVLGLIPIVNLVCMAYFIGTPKDRQQ